MSDNAAVAPKTLVPLPIITATIDSGKVAALAMKTTGAQLGAAANNIVSDITLIKILKDETGAKFGYTAEPAGYADQSFTLKNADGNNLAFTDKIDPAATYTLILFVILNIAERWLSVLILKILVEVYLAVGCVLIVKWKKCDVILLTDREYCNDTTFYFFSVIEGKGYGALLKLIHVILIIIFVRHILLFLHR